MSSLRISFIERTAGIRHSSETCGLSRLIRINHNAGNSKRHSIGVVVVVRICKCSMSTNLDHVKITRMCGRLCGLLSCLIG